MTNRSKPSSPGKNDNFSKKMTVGKYPLAIPIARDNHGAITLKQPI